MNRPTAVELVGPTPRDLDEKWVLKNFLGKTQDEAKEMFRLRQSVTEDFTYMAPAGLAYYLPAASENLESDESTGDVNFASGLLCALSIHAERGEVQWGTLLLMKKVAEYCDRNRVKFDPIPRDLVGFSFLEGDSFESCLETIRSAEPAGPANEEQPMRVE